MSEFIFKTDWSTPNYLYLVLIFGIVCWYGILTDAVCLHLLQAYFGHECGEHRGNHRLLQKLARLQPYGIFIYDKDHELEGTRTARLENGGVFIYLEHMPNLQNLIHAVIQEAMESIVMQNPEYGREGAFPLKGGECNNDRIFVLNKPFMDDEEPSCGKEDQQAFTDHPYDNFQALEYPLLNLPLIEDEEPPFDSDDEFLQY